MSYEVELQKLKNEYPKFFEKNDPEIIDLVLSDDTTQKISDICEKNGVKDENKIEEISQRISWVLLDKLPSGNLAMSLQSWVELNPETAIKIADEANRFISSSMIKLNNSKQKKGDNVAKKKNVEKPVVTKEEPKKSSSEDVYRELVD